MEARFREQFAQRKIDIGKLPSRYRVNLWGIGHIRRRTALGRLIARLEGFDHISLPKGPDQVIAMIKLAEGQVGRGIRLLHPFVRDYLHGLDTFDLEQVSTDRRINQQIDRCLNLPWLTAD